MTFRMALSTAAGARPPYHVMCRQRVTILHDKLLMAVRLNVRGVTFSRCCEDLGGFRHIVTYMSILFSQGSQLQ